MFDLIEKIIEYLNTQDACLITNNLSEYDQSTLNSVCHEVLSWLRLERKREIWIEEGRRTSLKPLEMKKEYKWCGLLEKMLMEDTVFSTYFEVINGYMTFKEEISAEMRCTIRTSAYEKYEPLKTVLKK